MFREVSYLAGPPNRSVRRGKPARHLVGRDSIGGQQQRLGLNHPTVRQRRRPPHPLQRQALLIGHHQCSAIKTRTTQPKPPT